MRLLPALALALATGCQPQLFARGVIEAPTPVIKADVTVDVGFFGVPLTGAQDVVFVLDHSGSMAGVATGFAGQDVGMSSTGAAVAGLAGDLVNMGTHSLPSKMNAAKQELVRTLSRMPDGTRFMIIFFDDKLAAFAPRMSVLDAQTRAAAICVRARHRAGRLHGGGAGARARVRAGRRARRAAVRRSAEHRRRRRRAARRGADADAARCAVRHRRHRHRPGFAAVERAGRRRAAGSPSSADMLAGWREASVRCGSGSGGSAPR